MKSSVIFTLAMLTASISILATRAAEVRAADLVRASAVLDLSFDEESGDAKNAAAATGGKGAGALQNGAQRTASPFWGQDGKQALILDAAAKQFVQVAGGPYLDRPDAVTLAFFFLNLHEPADEAFHGLIAKRTADDGRTNYGINFNAKSNVLQLYVNDGAGFRAAVFDSAGVIGSRRLVHLTATFQVGDAPAPDEDAVPDDLLVRLFLNGQPVAPKAVTAGSVAANDAWINDVNAAGILNDTPLIIGASDAAGEYASGLFDELLVFSRALEPQEVATLFAEVAGPNGAELANEELERRPLPEPPQITALSLYGLQTGTTTRLVIDGARLDLDPHVVLPVAELKQSVAEGSNSARLMVDLEIPAGAQTGYYPLCVQSKSGVSNVIALAIDELPQFATSSTSPQAPASLPGAFSGTVAGTEQARVYFQGKAGQRLVADLEARRLGAAFDPVLEIKTERGTPLAIEWGQVILRGDPRAEIVLPEDGLYFAEIHDLSYSAAGRNPFRVKLGDLTLIDALFPPAAARGADVTFETLGGGDTVTRIAAKLPADPQLLDAPISLPQDSQSMGPAPVIALSDGVEIIETTQPAGQMQTLSALFLRNKHVPIHVSGRISQPGEVDRYLLVVTPGDKLTFALEGRAIDSPISGSLSVLKHPEGTPLASGTAAAGSRDPRVAFDVPADVHEIQLAVGDMLEKGGPRYLYRLKIVPAGQPDFDLNLTTTRLGIPSGGSALARVEVERKGYGGPVRLRVVGDENITVTPSEVPAAGRGKQQAFITLTAQGRDPGALANLRIVGESVDLDPPIHRAAMIATSGERIDVPGHRAWLPAAVTAPSSASLNVKEFPPTLWRGLPATLAVEVGRTSESKRPIRLTLVSTEEPRPVSNEAAKGNKPMVRTVGGESVAASADSAQLQLAVPVDVGERAIGFVVRADVLPHAYSSIIEGTAFSQPVHLPVQTAAAIELDAASLTLTSGSEGKIRGTLKRTTGFALPVEVALAGLPAGYAAAAVTVPPDQEQFEISVTVPQGIAAGDVPNVQLKAGVSGSGQILPDQPLALKVQ